MSSELSVLAVILCTKAKQEPQACWCAMVASFLSLESQLKLREGRQCDSAIK